MDFDTRLRLAKIYKERGGEPDKIIKALKGAVNIQPLDIQIHAYLGEAYQEKNLHPLAIQEFKATIHLLKDMNVRGEVDNLIADFYCRVAKSYLAQGNKKEAKKFAKEALVYKSNSNKAKKLLRKCE